MTAGRRTGRPLSSNWTRSKRFGGLFQEPAVQVGKRAARLREIAYQATVRSYSGALKPGITRGDVEAFLRRNGRTIVHSCCMESEEWKQVKGLAFDDLAKIGEERAPWFCSEHNVYVGFEFVAVGTHEWSKADDADRLTKVRLYHALEGCL